MALPYYVSPEQIMQDKAEYARKGISKGRSIIALEYTEGILLVADNPSVALNKISEIYDAIAFAGAGRYSEFENLRKAGIRHADLKGYLYSREDVTAKSLTNTYSQSLGTSFSQDIKPLEIEILVVGVGEQRCHEIYRVAFDGSIYDEKGFTAIGGKADTVITTLQEHYKDPVDLRASLKLSVKALESVNNHTLQSNSLEVAVLDQNRPGRKFKRFKAAEIQEFLK